MIGLEIHVHLKTRTKMFCRCQLEYFAPENSRTCPVCLAHPGALPVPNERAVEMTMLLGLGLGCEIAERATFHRKHYFYPDTPKGYQISQYDEPLCVDGKMTLATADGELEVGIVRAHLEEDAAKNVHMGGAGGRIAGADRTLVDFNRAGTPLVEIVTAPDIHSAEHAKRFLQLLRQTVVELGISDAEMEKGSLRFDVNVSVRPEGSDELRTRTELKNMNSFNFAAKGIEREILRQIEIYESGGEVVQETMHFDPGNESAPPLRSKEEAQDYRYLPEPDLVPLEPPRELVDRLRAELARASGRADQAAGLRARFRDSRRARDERPRPTLRARRRRPARGGERADEPVRRDRRRSGGGQCRGAGETDRGARPDPAAGLYRRSRGQWRRGLLGRDISRRRSDQRRGDLEPLVDQVLAANPGQVESYRSGKEGLLGFFVGAVMKETEGRANPKLVSELLRKKLSS